MSVFTDSEIKPGIYTDISIDDYHNTREVVSSTGVKEVKKSPKSFAHYLIHGTKTKSHFDFGNAFEVALVDKVQGTGEFGQVVAVEQTEYWSNRATAINPKLVKPKSSGDYKKLRSEFLEENEGKYIISDVGPESMVQLEGMVEACLSDKAVVKLLTDAEYQVSLIWQHANGLLCKTRPDLAKPGKNIMVDIKTCKDASPGGFARDAANYDYPLQAIMQIDGAIQTGYMQEVERYLWLAVEKEAPYNHALYEFQLDDRQTVRDSYERYLDRCARTIDEIKEGQRVKSYAVDSFDETGIMSLEIPLWYRSA